jgi:hypothetical protein
MCIDVSRIQHDDALGDVLFVHYTRNQWMRHDQLCD